jgi:hypothetical protein
MPSWLARALGRVRKLASEQRVCFTLKAQRELAALGLDVLDGCEALANLTSGDAVGRLRSGSTGEWMYVFKPVVAGEVIYLKLILRSDCIIVSFHEDEGGRDEEQEP